MSRLIFEGDTISRFGKKIPTPFIEKLKIYQDSFECTISIYLHITENTERNEEIYEDLSNLKLFYGFGQTNPVPIELNLGQDDYFALVDENIYNSEGQRFAKFAFIRREAYQQDFQLRRAISDNLMRETYFSCFIAVSEDERDVRNSRLTGLSTDDQEIKEFDRRGNYNIYSNAASPLVYEKVFTAPIGASRSAPNRIATDPINLYEDSSGLPCETTPLQSIQKDYYKTTDSFREDLKKQIDNLVASYGEVEDQQLQSFLDSISYVSETQNRSVEFIVELDKVRNSFPSRTSISPLGTLYNRLKTVIFSANDTLILGERLQKKIVPNTKLASYIGIEEENREASWTQRSDATLYSPRPDDTGKFLYNKFFMERQELEVDKLFNGEVYDEGQIQEPNYDVVRNFGYFFLDYEKAIQKKSNISQIYPVQKLLNLFGNNSLDGYFQISKTELLRFNSDKDIVQKIVSIYQDNLTSTSGRNTGSPESVLQVVFKEDPDIERNYVVLRKFDTVRGLNGYRLLAFEYQDFQPSSTATRAGQSYRFNIEIEDKTIDFYDVLKSHFKNQISKLLYYLELAREFCSYNNIDGRFNDFFVEGIKERFIAVGYPWVSSALIYAIHLDLIEDAFQGNFQLIKNYADFFSDSYLNPQITTLEILENKVALIVEFYEKYYGDDGIITREVDELPSPDGVPTGRNLRDNMELVFTNGYDEFPDIVDFTRDYEPTVIKRWNGNEELFKPSEAKQFIAETMTRFIFAGSIGGDLSLAVSDPEQLIGFVQDEIEFYGTGAVAGTSTVGGNSGTADATKYKSKNEKSARRIYNFIIHMLGAIRAGRSGEFTYQERKDAINHQINRLDGGSDLPDPYKDLKSEEEDFIKDNRAYLGNIALFYIKAERTGLFDPHRFITDTFAGIQGRT